ncbi:MAG: DUF547 domain-containing protein [Sphingomonadales bacterium]|nr:MAG: DUF547 domain-containing protein [Sphingomonadales bacterium]
MIRNLLSTVGVAAALLAAPVAQAQTVVTGALSTVSADPAFDRFVPGARNNGYRIDYTAWNEALSYLVFSMGRSIRENPGRPDATLGSRRLFGHDSRYRLEGNRVMFSFFTPELRQLITDYRQELEETASTIDLQSYPRNEQLAFWINFHNVALMDMIAREWPVRQPSSIEIDGVPLDQAKFLTVQGVKMSLHDIRHQIVYRNWKDPRVIYGFWRGEIGGPSIQSDAFNGATISERLDRSAREFVNSLRGVQKAGTRMQVSDLYEEVRPYYFADWPGSLRPHIAGYAEEEVTEILAETTSIEAVIYERDIADLAGGVREPSYSNVTSTGTDGIERSVSFRIPAGTARLLREQQQKMQKILRETRTGEVIFTPITLPGDAGPPEVE